MCCSVLQSVLHMLAQVLLCSAPAAEFQVALQVAVCVVVCVVACCSVCCTRSPRCFCAARPPQSCRWSCRLHCVLQCFLQCVPACARPHVSARRVRRRIASGSAGTAAGVYRHTICCRSVSIDTLQETLAGVQTQCIDTLYACV